MDGRHMKKIETDFSHLARVGKVKVANQILLVQDEICPERRAIEFDDCCAYFELGWNPARLVTMGYSATRKHKLGLND